MRNWFGWGGDYARCIISPCIPIMYPQQPLLLPLQLDQGPLQIALRAIEAGVASIKVGDPEEDTGGRRWVRPALVPSPDWTADMGASGMEGWRGGIWRLLVSHYGLIARIK